jgi:hypothetical protein
MRKIVFFALIALFSCKSKEQKDQEAREKAKQDAQELVNKMAAPLIANEIGDLNILYQTATNKQLTQHDRLSAADEMIHKYPEYLYHLSDIVPAKKAKNKSVEEQVKIITDPNYYDPESEIFLDSLEGTQAKYWITEQKKLIEAKWKNEAAKQVYKQALEKQYSNQ